MNNRFYNLAHTRIDIESMIANATEENRNDLLNHILWHLPAGTAFKNSDREDLVADITAELSDTPVEPTPDPEQTPDPEPIPDVNDDELVPGQDENDENEVIENEVTENEDLSEIDVEE